LTQIKHLLYPGSFDPPTNGHTDIIERFARQFDQVTVGVGVNTAKSSLLPIEKRIDLLQEALKHLKNVKMTSYQELTVTFAKKIGAGYLGRSIRDSLDLSSELRIAHANLVLDKSIETVVLFAKPELQMISSTMVKEVWTLNGDISKFVPKNVLDYLLSKGNSGVPITHLVSEINTRK
jgi:pantetheine-phosphate adenylyltransferase